MAISKSDINNMLKCLEDNFESSSSSNSPPLPFHIIILKILLVLYGMETFILKHLGDLSDHLKNTSIME